MLKLFGIQIERKTDILAFAAFLISLGSVFYQLQVYLEGPDVVAFPPNQILLTTAAHEKGQPDDPAGQYLRVIARMAYVNNGQAGFNAVILNEQVSFELEGRDIEMRSQKYVSTWSESTEFVIEVLGPVRPHSIAGGNTFANEVVFAPRSVQCQQPGCDRAVNYVLLGVLIEEIRDYFKQGEALQYMPKRFNFVTEVVGEADVVLACTVYFSRKDAERLANPAKGWVAPSCFDKPPAGGRAG